jgi:hypothetical protein
MNRLPIETGILNEPQNETNKKTKNKKKEDLKDSVNIWSVQYDFKTYFTQNEWI